MIEEKDWLYEWKRMMCKSLKVVRTESGPTCVDKQGNVIIGSEINCKQCPYH